MCAFERVSPEESIREAQACCDRIAALLSATSDTAEKMGDLKMVADLAAARAAANRAMELIARLGAVLGEGDPGSVADER
ncbi:MAG TPA: hypothetical protein VHE36_07775 [Sphingomicrobium sp.]|nr:hypothetical protein [Sphingomicrobium sp.]